MNVQQLIEQLQKIPNKNLTVVVNNKNIKNIEVSKNLKVEIKYD